MTPTLAEVRAWDTTHLTEAATHWAQTAELWEDAFSQVSTQMGSPGGSPWEGVAAAAAQQRAYRDRLKVVGVADQLHGAAEVARRGAAELSAAKQAVLDAVGKAQQAGFTVTDDFSVTSRERGSAAFLAGRQAQAEGLAADIRARLGELVSADKQIAAEISAATAGVGETTFAGSGPAAQGFDHHWKQEPAPLDATDMSSGDLGAIEQSNRELLQQMYDEYSALPAGQVRTDRLADIAAIRKALEVPGSHLVYLAKPGDPSQMIPAATSVGDPFTADRVSVTVPGVSSTTRASLPTMTTEAFQLRAEAGRIASRLTDDRGNALPIPDIATVAWMGYEPPLSLVSMDTANDDLAQAGATKLNNFLQNLDSASHNPGHTTALFGHSYGSLTSGIALKEGASSVVDNAVLYGSPGFEATSTAQLGMNDHNFFVMSADKDLIAPIGALAPLHGWGADPNDIVLDPLPRYRFPHLETDAGMALAPGEGYKLGASGHGEYPHDAGERMTGYNLATILLNRPDLAVRETPFS